MTLEAKTHSELVNFSFSRRRVPLEQPLFEGALRVIQGYAVSGLFSVDNRDPKFVTYSLTSPGLCERVGWYMQESQRYDVIQTIQAVAQKDTEGLAHRSSGHIRAEALFLPQSSYRRIQRENVDINPSSLYYLPEAGLLSVYAGLSPDQTEEERKTAVQKKVQEILSRPASRLVEADHVFLQAAGDEIVPFQQAYIPILLAEVFRTIQNWEQSLLDGAEENPLR